VIESMLRAHHLRALSAHVQPRLPLLAVVNRGALATHASLAHGGCRCKSTAPEHNSHTMDHLLDRDYAQKQKERFANVQTPEYLGFEPVSEAEVLECQAKWAAAIENISSVYLQKGDFVGAAGEAAGELYGYGHHNVLFKPTKATAHPFRDTPEIAMSYFVGAEAMGMDEFKGEDAGFAINGGKGWKKVVFSNHQIDLHGPVAIAMGSYDFTCATTGEIATVEYTFGYKRCADGKPRICLHHSSVPYGH